MCVPTLSVFFNILYCIRGFTTASGSFELVIAVGWAIPKWVWPLEKTNVGEVHRSKFVINHWSVSFCGHVISKVVTISKLETDNCQIPMSGETLHVYKVSYAVVFLDVISPLPLLISQLSWGGGVESGLFLDTVSEWKCFVNDPKSS